MNQEPMTLQTCDRLRGSSPHVSSESTGLKPLRGFERLLRTCCVRRLRGIPGQLALTVRDADGQFQLGRPDEATLAASIIVHDPAVYWMLVWQGSLGACEAYLRGYWTTPDLYQTLQVFSRMFDTVVGMDTGLAWLSAMLARLVSRRRHNSPSGSRRNIAEHYDLSNEFFALFLDSSMMYSSACYDSPDMTLEAAAKNKLRVLCQKLQLESSDHLLEIGTGWGGFALYAAEQYGCRVTTTTISAKQHDYARHLFHQTGLDDRITLLHDDYRDLRGTYDKIVSIEMIEAVGKDYLHEYFRCCDQLLRPGGKLVIQAIVIPEQRYHIYERSVDFIQTYIFPGSFLPSIASMQQAVGQMTNLRLVGLQDYTPSYVQTLHEWRLRFHKQLEAVRALGFDERFIRMWDFYLTSCEAVFHERAAGLVQLEWIKPC